MTSLTPNNKQHDLLGLKDTEWKMIQEQLRKGGHTTTMSIKEAIKDHLKELDEKSEHSSSHTPEDNEDEVSLCESTASSKMSASINSLLPHVLRRQSVTSTGEASNDLGERLWKNAQSDEKSPEFAKNIYEQVLKAGADEDDDDNEWDGLWNKPSESNENSTNTKRRHSLMKKAKSTLSSSVMSSLRQELSGSTSDLQARKRQRNNTGDVNELIVRMSSSNLLRTSPSGRLLEPSFRNKASGEANATFSLVDKRTDSAPKGELLEPFGRKL